MSCNRKCAVVFALSLGLLTASIAGIADRPAHAATLTWDNDADPGDGNNTDFNNAFNWGAGQTGTVPGAADNATFSGAAVSSPNLSAADSIQGLTFLAGASGYTLSSSGPTLTLTNVSSGLNSAINAANTSGTNTISAAIILG